MKPGVIQMVLMVCVVFGGCATEPSLPPLSAADSLRIVQENLEHRASMDAFFAQDPGSPFVRDTTVTYTGIKWFPVDPRYCVSSVLHRYPDPKTVKIAGTKGEIREQLRYGYFEVVVPDTDGNAGSLRFHVYKFTPRDSLRYARYRNHLSMWCTDLTTGKETYHVGRYLELGEEHPDPEHVYSLDLNKLFNPYCAYSDLYSCAVPSEEDRLPIALHVGEMNYHE